MDDLAFIYHWSWEEMLRMRCGQILARRAAALARHNRAHGGER